MTALADGDREAFDAAYREAHPLLLAYARRILGDGPDAEDARGRGFHLFYGVLLGLILGALGFAIAASTVDVVRAALPLETAAVEPLAAYPARELSREWRGERKAIDVDYMYRQKASPRLDWIRKGGGR